MHYKNILLDKFQEEAIKAIDENLNIIVGAPTGAGKTLIAEYAIEKSIRQNKKIIYTAPIKALSNQKFRDFTNEYQDKIGILTGDVSINPFANAVIMTTEIFRNSILDEPQRFEDTSYVILDEVHYIDDEERGTVWEESIIFAPKHIKFLCLSATVSNIYQFANWIQEVRESQMRVIIENHRPVPLKHFLVVNRFDDLNRISVLEFEKNQSQIAKHFYKMISQHKFSRRRMSRREFDGNNGLSIEGVRQLIDYLRQNEMMPVLWFAFSRKLCEELAHNFSKECFLNVEQKNKVVNYFDELCSKFSIDSNIEIANIRKYVMNGVCYHHAGLLPTLKEIIERLFTTGFIKLLFATETFSLGVNMPAKSVVLNTLHKFDGFRHSMLKTREFQQMTGRCGRRGIDEIGYSFSIIDSKSINYNINKIISGVPEPLTSQFNMSYSTILSLIKHLGRKIYTAWEKSFGFYLIRKTSEKKKDRYFDPRKDLLGQLRRRIEVLRHLKYLDGWYVTEKGSFASYLYAYELPLSELYFGGVFDELIPEQLAVLICAIVFKSKRQEWHANLSRVVLGKTKNVAIEKVNYVIAVERALGIKVPTSKLDFGLGKAIYEWCLGKNFDDIKANTSASDGDIVRNFRIVIQVARLLIKSISKISKEPPDSKQSRLISRLCRTIRLINRDEVDAEKQLRTQI